MARVVILGAGISGHTAACIRDATLAAPSANQDSPPMAWFPIE